jgi:hypothetical protein
MEDTGTQGTCQEERGASEVWVTVDLNGVANEDTQLGTSHVQSGVFVERRQQSDTVRELQTLGKGKELKLTVEDMDGINRTVSHLSDAERELIDVCIHFGLEDVSAMMQKEMDALKLYVENHINKFMTAEKELKKLEQKKQEYISDCSNLSLLMQIMAKKQTLLENCESAMFKGQVGAFHHGCESEKIGQRNFKIKKNCKQFQMIKAMHSNIRKSIEREMKGKCEKRKKIEISCAKLRERKEMLLTQFAALKRYSTLALEVDLSTLHRF